MRIIMKISILVVILTLILGCTTIYTRFNEEIDNDLRISLKNKSLAIIKGIKSGDDKFYKDLLSDEFLKNTPDQKKLQFALERQFNIERYELIEEYYTHAAGSISALTIITDEEKRLLIQQMQPMGKYSYAQFWKSDSLGLQHILFFYYGKQDNKWKLFNLYIGDYSIENQIAPDLIKKSNKLCEDKKYLSSLIYALASQKVMRPAPFLLYKNEVDYKGTIDKIIKKFESNYHLPILLEATSGTKLFSIDLVVTTSGITPIFSYFTHTDISNQKQVMEESDKVFTKISNIFPDTKDYFQYIALKAFNELPTNPGKEYHGYGTVFKDGKRAKF